MTDWIPVIVSIIAAVGSIIGVVLTNSKSNQEMDAKLDKTQAVFEAHVSEQIDALRKQVERHNTIIERTYKLEQQSALTEAELKRHNERLKALEKGD